MIEYTFLGKTKIKISKIGIGTWQWGTRSWGYGEQYSKADLKEAFDLAVDQGINFIDTAEMYGGGLSERLLGEFARKRRDDLVIASKVMPQHLTYSGVIRSFKKSAKRLQTDYIDLYYVHWPNPLIPMKWTARAFLDLYEKRKIRAIGVSNFSLTRMIKFDKLVNHLLSANQVRYSLLHRKTEKRLLPYCIKNNITLVAYSPLDQGAVLGKYNEKNLPKDIWRRANTIFTPINMKRLKPLKEILRSLAQNHGVKPINIVLRYLIEKNAIPIVGIKNKKQVTDLLSTFDFNLKTNKKKLIDKTLSNTKIAKIRAYPYVLLRILRG